MPLLIDVQLQATKVHQIYDIIQLNDYPVENCVP